MQENKERMENKDLFSVNSEEKVNEVVENQGNLFDSDQVFTEAMVVEKEQIDVDSSAGKEKVSNNGDTAIFTFAKDKPKNSEIEHQELTVSDIESSAKEYYNANHAGDIEGKVQELRNLANSSFSDDETGEQFMNFEAVEQEDTDDVKRKEKERKKKIRRGVISNDDMELLSSDDSLLSAQKRELSGADKASLDETRQYENIVVVSGPDRAVVEEVEVDSTAAVDLQQDVENDIQNVDQTAEDEADAAEKELFKALDEDASDDLEYLKKYENMYTEDDVEYEYTSRDQDSTILMELRNKAMKCMTALLLTLIACIACICFEVAAVTRIPNPAFLEAGKFGVTYSMLMLQIMFVCVILNFDGMKRGFKGLRPSKASVESFTAVICLVCTVHSVASSLLAGNDMSLRSYCSIGCIALFMLSSNSFFKAQTTLRAFCIAASKKPKFTCESKSVDKNSDEAACFENYLDDEATVVSVRKSSFVEGFFKKTQRIPLVSKNSFMRICVSLAVSALFGIIYGIVISDVYAAINAFTMVSLMSLPVNALFMTSLPFFKASAKISETQTAFIGEAVCDAYDDTNIISFDDTEVFPPRAVKVSSIRTYENNRIDKAILYMARIFDAAKGPLSYVFANSVRDVDEAVGEAQITKVYDNGLCAQLDGKNMLVGKAEFMMINNIVTVEDNIDETFENSSGSIMYMAIDGCLAAKFYIKYSINNEFETMLRSFYDAGVCVAVKTLDPSINTELVSGFLKGANYPLAVVTKTGEETVSEEISEKTESTIISLSGVHNFLKSFIKADNLRNVYRTNSLFALISAILGFLITAAGILFVGSEVVSVLFMIVLQLIWCVPVVLISLASK